MALLLEALRVVVDCLVFQMEMLLGLVEFLLPWCRELI